MSKTPIQARLASKKAKPASRKPAPLTFAQKLLRHPDDQVASELVAEQAAHEFDRSEDGKTLATVQDKAVELNERFEKSRKDLDRIETKLEGTQRYQKSGGVHTGDDSKIMGWRDWQRKDQILLILVIVLLCITLGMGMGNVYANLMASGNPVFVNAPWLAVMLSTLLPIGSATVKFGTNFMSLDSSRRRYACVFR